MGAWGYGPFENDDAMDFVGDLETATGTGHLSTILYAISDDRTEYVEAPESSVAIAAAEVVAALLGHPHPALSRRTHPLSCSASWFPRGPGSRSLAGSGANC